MSILLKMKSMKLLPLLVLAGCAAPEAGRYGQGGGSADGSILTAVNGIKPEDKVRDGMHYTLNCDSGTKADGKLRADGQVVAFASTTIKAGDSCWMEAAVTADAAAALKGWKWYGVDKDGKERTGLLYGTDKQKVQATLVLDLTVYQLYEAPSDPSDPTFSIKLWTSFDVSGGQKAAVAGAVANLDCGGADKLSGTLKSDTAGKTWVLVENKSLKTWKDKACTKVSVLSAEQVTFQADLTDVSLATAAADTVLAFPDKDGTKTYQLKPVTTGDVAVNTLDGGSCLKYSSTSGCEGLEWQMPWAHSYMAARVLAKKTGSSDNIVFWVGAGDNFGVYDGAKLTAVDLNTALTQTAPKFSFYKDTVEAVLKDQFKTGKFDADFLAGTGTSAYKAKAADLAGVQILSIDQVWVHGFHKVDGATLNAMPSAYWLALVHATKSGSIDQDFIAGGKDKYLHSASAPTTINGAPAYLNTDLLAQEMSSAQGSSKWSVYTVKGGAMSTAGCAQDQSYFKADLSLKNLGTMPATDAKLDACEVTTVQFNQGLKSGWNLAPTFYVWEWFSLPKN